jgi:hypothetical protein
MEDILTFTDLVLLVVSVLFCASFLFVSIYLVESVYNVPSSVQEMLTKHYNGTNVTQTIDECFVMFCDSIKILNVYSLVDLRLHSCIKYNFTGFAVLP